ncbi:putative DNA-binding protein (MmcQ/YjbR family) [Deinobacterium chartae]|uniref:Putative DNA-binding protein (MmcQ/YjbR family) n=1 Tax=Deinobacterium chartae TaxID=521158 RepID=A0A841I6N7_9DEIO|nr:MmcQ/YjbR family DNA-binding protein [Deinobacterium chartae]MBB6099495.1 putative DNA-binding protein (MmcQ/YjbR family) [Deinobacterium chartae]
MDSITALREYCAAKPGSEETFPFGLDTLVWKVGGKMYALASVTAEPLSLSLKCDPERALELREQYGAITAGYHLNKRHWNSLEVDRLPPALVRELIDHSYALVVRGLTRAERERLGWQASARPDHLRDADV